MQKQGEQEMALGRHWCWAQENRVSWDSPIDYRKSGGGAWGLSPPEEGPCTPMVCRHPAGRRRIHVAESEQLAGSVNLGSGQDTFALVTNGCKMGHIWLLPLAMPSGRSVISRQEARITSKLLLAWEAGHEQMLRVSLGRFCIHDRRE